VVELLINDWYAVDGADINGDWFLPGMLTASAALIVAGCSTDQVEINRAVAFTDVCYIKTITEAGPAHLEASQRYGSNRIGGETLGRLPIANEAFAWRYTGEGNLSIQSQNC